jgi:hypothetical protein
MSKTGKLSLRPLGFKEAVSDILKVKPEPKAKPQPKPKARRKERAKK